MELIDKAAVVAEIKKRCKEAEFEIQCATYRQILSFLNTLEVKEVDLEKEYEKYYEQERYIQTFKLAKHFFELGLKAKGD